MAPKASPFADDVLKKPWVFHIFLDVSSIGYSKSQGRLNRFNLSLFFTLDLTKFYLSSTNGKKPIPKKYRNIDKFLDKWSIMTFIPMLQSASIWFNVGKTMP